jgi:aldehyde dehydrogenase (NAD+)
MFERRDHFIGGKWPPAAGTDVIEVVSPSTEEVVGRVPVATTDEVDAAVAAARRAFDTGTWPRLGLDERAGYLSRFVDALEARRETALRLQIDEMGATRKFAIENYDGIGPSLERMITDAEAIRFREVRAGMVGKVVVLREPVGVVAGVTPWNSPIAVELSKIFPSLLMGCPIVVKPAPESPLSAYVIGEAAVEAGLPEGVISIVNGGVDVGAYLVGHPSVDYVTFTGSPGGGRAIASTCADRLCGVTLELGGKSAAVILPGTDMTPYVPALVGGSLRNSGQICVSTNRVLVHEDDRDRVVGQLVDYISVMKVGDPHDPDVDFGPLAARRQRDTVERFIASGVAAGAKIVLGGGRPDRPKGWYVEPTVFVDVDNKMRIAQEEIFGPVACVLKFSDESDVLAKANDIVYGLAAGIQTNDLKRAHKLARRLKAGSVWINTYHRIETSCPFGGYKLSGYGRENGVGMVNYLTRTKSVAVDLNDYTMDLFA